MLSRSASELYWLSRYLERAENIARILDVNQLVAMLSSQARQDEAVIEPLVITNALQAFHDTQPAIAAPNFEAVAGFLAWNAQHPSSISRCLEACRDNAKAVRGAITSEMWECINDTWMQLQSYRKRQNGRAALIEPGFFDWVKERSRLFFGVSLSTLRRGQPFLFLMLGTYIERADNTARILAVKQKEATQGMPTARANAGLVVGLDNGHDASDANANRVGDYYRLGALLRSVSAMEAYRDVYRDMFTPQRIAELLIFEASLPRSLRYCLQQIVEILEELPSNRGREARKLAGLLFARLEHGDLQDVWREGLTNYLDRFMSENLRLAEAVHAAYLELN